MQLEQIKNKIADTAKFIVENKYLRYPAMILVIILVIPFIVVVSILWIFEKVLSLSEK